MTKHNSPAVTISVITGILTIISGAVLLYNISMLPQIEPAPGSPAFLGGPNDELMFFGTIRLLAGIAVIVSALVFAKHKQNNVLHGILILILPLITLYPLMGNSVYMFMAFVRVVFAIIGGSMILSWKESGFPEKI